MLNLILRLFELLYIYPSRTVVPLHRTSWKIYPKFLKFSVCNLYQCFPPSPSLFLYGLLLPRGWVRTVRGKPECSGASKIFRLISTTVWNYLMMSYFGVLQRNLPGSNQVKRTSWEVFLLHCDLACVSVDSWRICASLESHKIYFCFYSWRVHSNETKTDNKNNDNT